MAVIDPALDALVIRVVYDGPPMAGKTTSLRTLAGKLGGQVHTPEEIDGRTLYFDWLDYTGGLFEGRRIRCQIVSVPGQGTLAARRRRLLESADAVVFVCDSTRSGLPQALSYFHSLQHVTAAQAAATVGIVVQANKRDAVDAAPLPLLNSLIGTLDTRTAVIESVATDGSGIREAFVFAVRLALDRVRELMRLGHLPTRSPEVNSADALLAAIKETEGPSLALAAQAGLRHTRLQDIVAAAPAAEYLTQIIAAESEITRDRDRTTSSTPLLPSGELPSGMIWPPIEGRVILHQIAAQPVSLSQQADGQWRGTIGDGWRIQSPAQACFSEFQPARMALLEWARAHSASLHVLSKQRCIALAEDGRNHYRLWQYVAKESLPERGAKPFTGFAPYPFDLPGLTQLQRHETPAR